MEKTVTIVSQATFTLFKGLTQKDLSGTNPAEHNRLNIRPTWSHGLDEDGKIQRFDFIQGDNTCPDYIVEWESFQKLNDNGTLGIKGNYNKLVKANPDTVTLAKLKEMEEENKRLREELSKKETPKVVDKNAKDVKVSKMEEA